MMCVGDGVRVGGRGALRRCVKYGGRGETIAREKEKKKGEGCGGCTSKQKNKKKENGRSGDRRKRRWGGGGGSCQTVRCVGMEDVCGAWVGRKGEKTRRGVCGVCMRAW